MTQWELNQAIASKTGESLRTIRRRGFSIIEPLRTFDPEDGNPTEPQIVDWDELDAVRGRSVA